MNNDETVKWLLRRIVDELTRKEVTVNDNQRLIDLLNRIVKELGEVKRIVDQIEQRIRPIDLGDLKRTIDQIEQRSQGIERSIDRINSMERTLGNIETKLASIDMRVQRS